MVDQIITANEIQIQQLVIEVKAIKVGKRQMTQSLFRQLPNRPIIDDLTYEIYGTPWCTVNYFWGDCLSNHLHVVWQHGDKIYRDCLYPPYLRIGKDETDGEYYARDARIDEEMYLRHMALILAAGKVAGWDTEKTGRITFTAGQYAWSVPTDLAYREPGGKGFQISKQNLPRRHEGFFSCYDALARALSRYRILMAGRQRDDTAEEDIDHAKEEWREALQELVVSLESLLLDVGIGTDEEALDRVSDMLIPQYETYCSALKEERDAPLKYKAAYEKVTNNLEQFYIAV